MTLAPDHPTASEMPETFEFRAFTNKDAHLHQVDGAMDTVPASMSGHGPQWPGSSAEPPVLFPEVTDAQALSQTGMLGDLDSLFAF